MEINTRKGHVKRRYVVDTNELSSNPSSDPIVDNKLHTYQVSSHYSIPVANKFHLLDVEEEIQMNTDKAVHEPAVVPTISESINLHSDLKDTNTKNTSLVGDTIHTFNSHVEQGCSDMDLTRSGSIDTDPEPIPEYRKCKAQISTKFGCVPLAPIYVYKGEHKVWHSVPDVLTAHRLIKNTGIPNFLGLQIPVSTNLNVSSWRKHLSDYFVQQLPDLIESGFPLDFDRTRNLQSTLVNHASARLYPDHVDRYIREEVGFKAMFGPLDNKPFDVHISPFMTREKSNSDSRRTIMDLSFPKGLSVNDRVLNNTYLGTTFQMHYPSVDSIIQTLNELGNSAHIFKVDISHAFRHVRIDSGDIDLLGLQHRSKLYLDLSLPFGFRLGAFSLVR